jgi:site-specific recombinase XerD
VPQDYFPSGPFLGQLPDHGEFDVLREDFLLGFGIPTARAYKTDLEDFREWCSDSSVDPLHAGVTDMHQYIRSLGERGYASGTIARRVAALRGFFGHLVTRGVLRTSPADSLDPP